MLFVVPPSPSWFSASEQPEVRVGFQLLAARKGVRCSMQPGARCTHRRRRRCRIPLQRAGRCCRTCSGTGLCRTRSSRGELLAERLLAEHMVTCQDVHRTTTQTTNHPPPSRTAAIGPLLAALWRLLKRVFPGTERVYLGKWPYLGRPSYLGQWSTLPGTIVRC